MPIIILILLSMLCISSDLVAKDRRANLMDRARQFSVNKNYSAAQNIYKSLIKKNPKDMEARLALGRITAWQGHHTEAEQIIETALDFAPHHEEGRIALARVCFWQGKNEKGLRILDKLLQENPKNAEALALQSKIIASQQASPTLKKRDQDRFLLRLAYRLEDISFADTAHVSQLFFSYRLPQKWGIRSSLQFIDKFDETEFSFHLGGSYWPAKKTSLSLDLQWAPGGLITPRQRYTFEVSQKFHTQLVGYLGYQFADYQSVDTHALRSGLVWYFYSRWDLTLRYFFTVSDFILKTRVDHSGLIRMGWNPIEALNLFFGYSRGSESFESGNPLNPLGGFMTNHLFGGLRWIFYQGLGLDVSVDHEWRDTGAKVTSYEMGLSYRW